VCSPLRDTDSLSSRPLASSTSTLSIPVCGRIVDRAARCETSRRTDSGIILDEGGGDKGLDHPPSAAAAVRRGAGLDGGAAGPPGSGKDLGGDRFDAVVGIGDEEVDVAWAALRHLREERRPGGLSPRRDRCPRLAPRARIGIEADGRDESDRDDRTCPTDLHMGSVDLQDGQSPSAGHVGEGFYALVDLLQHRSASLRDREVRQAPHLRPSYFFSK
jgi:hypothetical protein